MVEGNKDGNAKSNSFAKTICSICYEDLKPTVEDLQSISVCGHVFHELCLQQWFEYCPDLKKRNCPICKQKCTNANVGRLYFQSVGDANDSSSQKPLGHDENPEELRLEVNRLEGKVANLSSTLEQQQKQFSEVKDQLFSCTEKLKAEVALKNESLAQVATSQQLLRLNSDALNKTTLECTRVKEKNIALAKELAAHKLASDVDLEEDEVLKLASFGNDFGSRDTIDTLKKSLVIRNKAYKELMAKCNILGRGEANYQRKLEKANKKIQNLKLRVQELEAAVEMKDNEALRGLKDQSIKVETNPHENHMKRPLNQINLEETSAMPDMTFCSRKIESCKPMKRKRTMDDNLSGFTNDQNEKVKGPPSMTNKDEDVVLIPEECQVPIPEPCFDKKSDVEMVNSDNKDGVSCSLSMRQGRKRDQANKLLANADDEVMCLGENNPVQSSVNIRNEISSSIPDSQPDDRWFSGGLLGPDGSHWHLGKWCKKTPNQGSMGLSAGFQRSNARTGDLIAVGADGRGGQIKVMRSLNQSSSDIRNTSSSGKKSKLGTKPKGSLQMEHFFQKTGR
ncbi:hypothetical protein ACS0TY_019346 [Phlomoides rotata]